MCGQSLAHEKTTWRETEKTLRHDGSSRIDSKKAARLALVDSLASLRAEPMGICRKGWLYSSKWKTTNTRQ